MSEPQTQRIRRLREALFLVNDTKLDIIEAVLAGARIDYEDDGLTDPNWTVWKDN